VLEADLDMPAADATDAPANSIPAANTIDIGFFMVISSSKTWAPCGENAASPRDVSLQAVHVLRRVAAGNCGGAAGPDPALSSDCGRRAQRLLVRYDDTRQQQPEKDSVNDRIADVAWPSRVWNQPVL
jgi:hypothetical protein